VDGTSRASSTALAVAKRRLRRAIRSRAARAASATSAGAAGEAVALRLLRAPSLWRRERWILYAALPDELPLWPLFERLRARGRAVLLPRLRGSRLEFAQVREPALALRPADVVLVPGRAFDRAGHRLGRGGGSYDRAFAAACAPPLRIGVGYAWQIIERVPRDSRDRRVDAIVTERALCWAGGRR